ncbi:nicotianamine synthase, S-adenosyl-L-methionine-dependent methyltransferase [Tanacetum coccineum]
MESLQVQVQEESILIEKVCKIYEELSNLETLKPSKDVDNLFTQLVHACIPHSPINQKTPKLCDLVGSGPLPFTSIVLASYHLKDTTFHNYDIDSMANSMASRLVSANHDLSKRMVFHTADIMDVTDDLKDYDVIFLAALVGMNVDEKNKVIQHLANSIHGFNVLSIFHPDDDVINSVVISRKFVEPVNIDNDYHALDIGSLMASSCKYCDMQPFNHPLGHMKMIDESIWKGGIPFEKHFLGYFALEMDINQVSVKDKMRVSLYSSLDSSGMCVSSDGEFCYECLRMFGLISMTCFFLLLLVLQGGEVPFTRWVALESTSCPICLVGEEDVSHALFQCPLAQAVLRQICRWWEVPWQQWASFSERVDCLVLRYPS